MEADLIWLAASLAFEQSIMAVVLFYAYHRKGTSLGLGQLDWKLAGRLLADSWPLLLTDMAIMLYMRLDQVMIQRLIGDSSVGYYAAALKLSESWYFIPVTICNSLFPAIVAAKQTDTNRFYRHLQRLYDLLSWTGITAAAVITVLAGDIIQLIFGQDFAPAAKVLSIHIWAGVFVCVGVASGKCLVAADMQRFYLVRCLVGSFTSILLNFYMIPRFGIVGAAWAALASQFIASYGMLVLYKRSRPNFLLATRSFNPVAAFYRLVND
jgi:O-antigen/teichoic acid export membrane protein